MLGGNKLIAVRSDANGKVYPMADDSNLMNFTDMLNMKIKADGPSIEGSQSILSNPLRTMGTVIDLGKNLLQYAKDGDLQGVELMMSKGAPFSADWLGMTAIHFAAINDSRDIADLLLRAGINRDAKTKVDRTALHLAAYYGRDKMAEMLLSKGKCNINSRDMLKMTPLHWAVEKRHKKVVEVLLKNDADPTAISKFNKTPIGIAVQTEQADVLEMLENARRSQQSKKYNEQHERESSCDNKETNDAVNSITGLTEDPMIMNEDEAAAENLLQMEADMHVEEVPTASVEPIGRLPDLERTANKPIEDSTLEMLKSHGISMMEDDEPSNTVLTSALQNGRKLVLSEGGKLLLNNTKVKESEEFGEAAPGRRVVTPATNIKFKAGMTITREIPGLKGASHVITKGKDFQPPKGKNVRVISLNEFHRMYGDKGTIKPQKNGGIFSPISNKVPVRITKVQNTLPVMTNNVQKKVYVNMKANNANQIHLQPQPQLQLQPQQSTNQIRVHTKSMTVAEDYDDEDLDLPENIIKAPLTDEEEDFAEIEPRKPTMRIIKPISKPHILPSLPAKDSTLPLPVKTVNIRPSSIPPSAKIFNAIEAMREITQLKSEVQDLKGKYDVLWKENNSFKQRLLNLEAMLVGRDIGTEIEDEDTDNIIMSDL